MKAGASIKMQKTQDIYVLVKTTRLRRSGVTLLIIMKDGYVESLIGLAVEELQISLRPRRSVSSRARKKQVRAMK